MTKMHVVYQGDLKCELTHEESGNKIYTVAPKDNGGAGDNFSPTDLFAASLVSCMITVMGITAKKHGIHLEGCSAHVEKDMALNPRRIGKLNVVIHMPEGIPLDKRAVLEDAAHHCPVHHSLREDIAVETKFIYI